MSETTGREMTLDEFCAKLPEAHAARQDLTCLRGEVTRLTDERDAAFARVTEVEGERDIAELLAETLRGEVLAAERRGAERALRWAGDNPVSSGGLRDLLGAAADDPANQWRGYIMRGLAALFPAPATDTQHQSLRIAVATATRSRPPLVIDDESCGGSE